MRVFIFSAAAGGGHIRTAQALEQYINHHVVDAKVKVVDYAFVNTILNNWIDQWNRTINN